MIRFFLYGKSDGRVFLRSAYAPSNTDWEDAREVVCKDGTSAKGINWDNVGAFYSSIGFDLPIDGEYVFDGGNLNEQ